MSEDAQKHFLFLRFLVQFKFSLGGKEVCVCFSSICGGGKKVKIEFDLGEGLSKRGKKTHTSNSSTLLLRPSNSHFVFTPPTPPTAHFCGTVPPYHPDNQTNALFLLISSPPFNLTYFFNIHSQYKTTFLSTHPPLSQYSIFFIIHSIQTHFLIYSVSSIPFSNLHPSPN